MTLRFRLGMVLIAATSWARASDAPHKDGQLSALNAMSSSAYRDVERSCSLDVQLLCNPNMEFPLMSMLSSSGPTMLFVSSSMDYTPIPSEFFVLDKVMDEFFDEAFGTFASFPETTAAAASAALLPNDGESSSTTIEILSETDEAAEIPHLAHALEQHAEGLRSDSGIRSELYSSVARRLTEADASGKPQQRRAQLPFRCKNQCLWKAFEQEMLSGDCSRAIWMMQNTHALEQEYGRRQEEFVSKLLVCLAAAFALSVFAARCVKGGREGRRARLHRKAMAAVYSNPSIRKQVELEIGESVERHGATGNARNRRGDSKHKKSVQEKERNLLYTKTISCKGVPVQIV